MAQRVLRSPARLLRAVALVVALNGAIVLSLSDRAFPLAWRAVSFALTTAHRVSDLFRLGPLVPDGATTVGSPVDWDTLGHFAMWGVIGLLAGLHRSKPLHRIWLWSALFALSAAIEVGQQLLSHSRAAEVSDLMANGVGLAVGITVGGVLHGVASTLWGLTRPARAAGAVT